MKVSFPQLQTGAIVGIIVAVAVFFFSAPLYPFAEAQTISDLSSVSIGIIPLNPAPGQTVTLTAQSFSTDLTQTNLSWTYGGKTIANGVGKTSVSVIAPAAGATATATVTVSGGGVSPITASVLLNPASVDVLWEAADSYVPPFYKGKASLSVGGAVRVTAIPATNAPRQATFSWSRNNSALQAESGVNRSSVLFANSIFNRQETVAVSVYGGTFQGNGSTSIDTTTPSVVAYQKNGGFIDYAHGSIDTILITGAGAILHFEPFYFSLPTTMDQGLSIALSVDGQPVQSDTVTNELRISRPDQPGTHQLTFAANTAQYSLQSVKRAFNLLFE